MVRNQNNRDHWPRDKLVPTIRTIIKKIFSIIIIKEAFRGLRRLENESLVYREMTIYGNCE